MIPSEIETKIHSIQQTHLLAYWDKLNQEQKKQLALQIQQLDIETYYKQKKLLTTKEIQTLSSIQPLNAYFSIGNNENKNLGLKLLSEKKCGCILMAGGEGTRLRFKGPKGMCPVTSIKHKTLFQLFAEKTLAAGQQTHSELPLAIMTSALNHETIISYFQKNKYFGLKPDQVSFYFQNSLPLLDIKGNLFLKEPSKIAVGPDGNGTALKSFIDSDIGKQWKERGIQYVNLILVDNALADPFDAELLGFHAKHNDDVTIKSTFRLNEEENVGLLVEVDGHIRVVEYSEVNQEERIARLENGVLKHLCANLSLYCLNMNFIHKQAYSNFSKMPLHKSLKATQYIDEHGVTKLSEKPIVWKFEHFIFDILPFANRVKVLVYPREICFAPLKNYRGVDSLETVQKALQYFDKITLEKITHQTSFEGPMEISQEFHYPTPELVEKWKGRSIPSVDYLSAF